MSFADTERKESEALLWMNNYSFFRIMNPFARKEIFAFSMS